MPVSQTELFHTPPIPGLDYREDVITPAQEAALIARIQDVTLSPFQFHGWEGRRLTHSYGWRYDFADRSFTPVAPIPDFLLPLRRTAAAFAGLQEEAFVQALLIRYDPGAVIGWHKDRPVFDQVVGVSLGAAAPMRFRRRTDTGFERRAVNLAPRSIYHLTGEVRNEWEHSIAALPETRWSVTFRSLSDKGRRAGGAA